MTDRTIISGVRLAAGGGVALALTGTLVSVAAGRIGHWWSAHLGVAATITVGLCAVVWVVVARQPRNASVWAMAAAPLGGVVVLVAAVAPFVADAAPEALRYPNYIPAEHPSSVAWMLMVAEPLSTVGVFVPVTLGLLLFPTGTLPSWRWRAVAWSAAASIAAVCVAYVVALRPGASRPPESWPVLGAAQFAVMAVTLLSIAAVFVRFGSSSGDARQQTKWVLWGGTIAVVALVVGMVIAGSAYDAYSPALVFTGFGVLIFSYGVAMARYRLYDVDLVVSRTIVYGSLAVIITGVYVAMVVTAGAVVGAAGDPPTALAITATAVVAAAFQPARRRLQRMADRLVHGRRSTPHEVLSEFARRVAANDERLLARVAKSLVDGTGASHVEVVVNIGGGPVTAAEWPAPRPENAAPPASTFSIHHRGVDFGSLVVTPPSGQLLSSSDRALVEQIAAGMGLALRNRALTETLARRVAELRESRGRLVRLQDEARRRLERDLHDGAQQQLVALRVKLGLAQMIAEKDGARVTVAVLNRLGDEADRVVDAVRDFARGVYPPLLEAEGLGPTIAALARRSSLTVATHTDGVGRHDRDVESTVYACVVEALRNVEEHARAREAVVTVTESKRGLAFEVRDDGVGMDLDTARLGTGLTNVADRVDALAGTLSLWSRPGGGTRVEGRLPVRGGSAP